MTPALLFALLCQAPASEEEAVQALIKLFTGEPVVEKDDAGRTRAIKLEGRPHKSTGSMAITFAEGRVVAIRGNGVGLSNDELALLKPFTALKDLRLHHNKGPGDEPLYDGSGLSLLKDLPLQELQVPGSPFTDAGLKAVAELKSLKSIGIWHVRVRDAGFAALAGHPSLEAFRLGGPAHTDKTLEYLSDCPKLASIRLNEAYVTYERGLKHLLKRKDTLKAVDLVQCVVAPEDLERLRAELPGVAVSHAGLAVVGKLLAEDARARVKLEKVVPPELLERYLAAAR